MLRFLKTSCPSTAECQPVYDSLSRYADVFPFQVHATLCHAMCPCKQERCTQTCWLLLCMSESMLGLTKHFICLTLCHMSSCKRHKPSQRKVKLYTDASHWVCKSLMSVYLGHISSIHSVAGSFHACTLFQLHRAENAVLLCHWLMVLLQIWVV